MFHYLFPPLTIGLGALMVVMEGLFLKTKDPLYETMARFWTRIFALNFAVGVASGMAAKLRAVSSPLIREVRGKGLMVGIELKQKVTPYLQELMSRGVMALPAGLTVMRFLPPLVITKDDLAKVASTVADVLNG